MPSRRLARVGIHDCYVALQYLLRGEKTMAPIHFTEDDRKGFRIPYAWGHGSCQVIIQNLIPRAEETFSFALIAHLGAEVTEACVMDRPGSVGGEVKVGDRDLFQVIVAGTGNGGDEEDNADASPVRYPKRAPEVPSSPAATGSTERLNRDIQNAHISLLDPSTSSRSSLPSSDSASGSNKRAATSLEERVSKKPKITYGRRRSHDDVTFTSNSDDEDRPPFSTSGSRNREGDLVTTRTGVTSMPPPVSRYSSATQQDMQSSFPSTIPNTERPSSPTAALLRTRKRAVSEIDSPRIILGDEIAPSSSAPASSPVKRACTASTPGDDTPSGLRIDVDGGHDELSFSSTDSPISSKKQTKPTTKTSSAKVHELTEPDLGELIPDIPVEKYQPRPSRSRSALAADDVFIPTDFSKRPESLAKKKTKSKRQKVAVSEEPDPLAKANLRGRQAKSAISSDSKDLKTTPNNTAMGEPRDAEDRVVLENRPDLGVNVLSPTKSESPKKPLPKKPRGRPRKGTTVEESEPPSVSEPIQVDKGVDQEGVTTSTPAPSLAKRGRKRKKSSAEDISSALVHEDPPSGDERNECVSATEGVLREADPNVRPLPEKLTTLDVEVLETPKPESYTSSTLPKSTHSSESPSKLNTVRAEEKKVLATGKDSPAGYRVGLSKRQRIAPLLRVVRK
ncbi:MAG: hypothetical protein LQ339_006516 [Xanthoria mediterranea]|nr:MAG: hypothetical protein LQ339_006516 [Xanthoria mediterranea]